MVLEENILNYVANLENVAEREQVARGNDEKLRVFCRGEKIFLVIQTGTQPLRIETRCDFKLGKELQGRYESVMQSRALGRNGIEIICSGQLSEDEVIDLVRHAYEISAEAE